MAANRSAVSSGFLVFLLSIFATSSEASTWLIKPDGTGAAPTIQTGVDLAAPGDTVLLASGTYTGPGNLNIDFNGKAITVRSETGQPEDCVLDCQGNGRGFYFHSGEGPSSVVEGVTVLNGAAYGVFPDYLGGGIHCFQSSPTVFRCAFVDCIGFAGGGAACYLSSATFTDCFFFGNGADSGGGIYFNSNNPVMSGCVVAHNQAGVGAGIRCGGGTLTVLDCTFSHNDPGGSSAAIYCETIALSLERTIVAFSGAGVECGSGVTVTLSCCNVYGNADGDWVGCIAGQSGTNGNFSEDPLFCNPAGDDFHLNIASPCTAANNSCSILVGALPVECGSRIQCPPDQLFAAVPGHVTFWELTGFVITNETGGNLSFDYHLDATGPGTLVDNGDPASLSGTTPVLAPGQPYVPPPAALQFPQLSEYAEQTVTYHIAEVGNPTAEDSCTTTIIFEASVPVAVRAFEAHSLAAGIELEWSVTADESFDGFEIYRSTGREDTAVRVNSDPIPASARSYLDGNVESGKTYRYTLSVVAGGDAKVRSQTITVRRAAAGPRLFQNHPNPFNPTTTLSFALPQSADVDLSIYTPAGQLVKRLASGIFPAGVKEIAWDGTDRNGNRVGSGVYFYRLKAGAFTETRKMILLK